MAMSLILTPPVTPAQIEARTKPIHRTRYKRIRFKAYKPEQVPRKTNSSSELEKSHGRDGRTISNQQTAEDSISETEFDAMLHRALESRAASPLTLLPANGTRQDPFTELPIKSGGIVPATLDYFLSICTPTTKGDFTVYGHENPHMTLLYPFMLQNAILFESIIALCRASILICVGKTAMNDRALVHHRSQAIKGVSQSLSTTNATDDGVLLSVAMLLTMEYLLGNNAAVAAHRKGLQRLIDMRLDLNDGTPWNTFVKGGLDAYKSLGSFVTGEPPEITADSHGYIHETFAGLWLDKQIVYPSLPFSPDLCTVLSRLPSGFSELCLSGRLSTQVMQVLASLSATTTSSDSEGFDDTRLDAEIQAMLSALQRLSLMRIASTEKYLTCGLVAYTLQLRRLRALNLFHDPTLKSFIQVIKSQEKPDSRREQRCMVWISVAVAGALNLRTIRMPGTHLILDKLFELYPAMSDWSTVETTLKSFFWTPSILNHWKKCHKAGVFRWKQLANTAQSKPLIDLVGTIEDVVDDEKPEPIDFEQLKLHAQGAPGAMINMMQAARCPFRTRMKMMDSATPMESPHG